MRQFPVRTCPAWLVLLLAVVAVACGSDSAEEQIRRVIERGEHAAEERDVRDLAKLVSEEYRDQAGRTKAEVLGIVRYYFLRSGSVHILSKIRGIRVSERDHAEAELLVAVAAKPIGGVEALRDLKAELHSLRLEFGRQADGKWRVVSGERRSAGLADFF